MTQIIACLLSDCAIQVSDRRLTWSDGRIKDDDKNKCVLFDSRVAFSYTGLAQVGALRTDIWLTNVLAQPECVSLPDAIRIVKARVQPAVASMRVPHRTDRHLTIAGIGWARPVSGELQAVYCRITNFYSLNEGERPSLQSEFTSHVSLFGTQPVTYCTVEGQPLPNGLARLLKYRLRRYRKKRASPAVVERALVETIRAAAREENTIGTNLLSVTIPKVAVAKESNHRLILTGGFLPDSVTFRAWPSGLWDGVVWGPNFAVAGTGISNFRAGSLESRCKLGGIDLLNGNDGRKVLNYPVCAIRRRSDGALFTLYPSNVKSLVILTEDEAVDRVLKMAGADAELLVLHCADELRRLLSANRSDFAAVFFNPGGTGPKSGWLAMDRVLASLD